MTVMMLAAATAWASTAYEVDVGRGPVDVLVPDAAGPGPLPLIVLLHGYGATGPIQEDYMRFGRLVDAMGFAYAYPTGVTNGLGYPAWNGTDTCCDWTRSIDDVGYLTDLLDAIAGQVAVDPKRVYFVGHSNGGFMSYRMACDAAPRVAAIASLAGATWADPADCAPSEPVAVLQIHGTADDTIYYDGGCIGACYPSAKDTVKQWGRFDGCAGPPVRGPALDLDATIAGAETRTLFVEDCDPGGAGALWTMDGGGHVPLITHAFAERVVQWLYAHPKP